VWNERADDWHLIAYCSSNYNPQKRINILSFTPTTREWVMSAMMFTFYYSFNILSTTLLCTYFIFNRPDCLLASIHPLLFDLNLFFWIVILFYYYFDEPAMLRDGWIYNESNFNFIFLYISINCSFIVLTSISSNIQFIAIHSITTSIAYWANYWRETEDTCWC
jgi:hypothetical protein